MVVNGWKNLTDGGLTETREIEKNIHYDNFEP